MTKIGVFDSGIGGLSIVKAIKKGFPLLEVVFVNDPDNLPYGAKTPDQMENLVRPKIHELIEAGCELIVIACNTVTTNIIDRMRAEYLVTFVGMEPMVKPASKKTKSRIITICATPATLKSNRYEWLKSQYANDIRVIEPDCSDWTRMIESDSIDEQRIKDIVDDSCKQGSDVIVLGCTHYHWIEDLIIRLSKGRAEVIQPEQAIISRLGRLLEQQP